MTDPMPAIYNTLGWPDKLRPTEPEPIVALDADGAALGINWKGAALDIALPYRILTGEANTPRWLRLRQTGVGASESSAVLGDSAWGTALTVYHQKIADTVEDATTDLMEFGHLAEDVIVKFMVNHPERFAWLGEIEPADGLLQSIEWPWLLGTLDRMLRTPDGCVPLELKSVNDFTVSEWTVAGVDGYVVPHKYQVQVQQQMAVTGTLFAYVAVWLGKGQLEVIRVDRDDAYIAEYLVGRVGDFWTYNVIARVPPTPTAKDDLWSVWPGDSSLPPIDADGDAIDLIGKWRTATTDARDLKKDIDAMKFEIAFLLGDATELRDPLSDKVIHTLKPQDTARGTDYDLLRNEYRDAYDACVKPAGRTRVHRATKAAI